MEGRRERRPSIAAIVVFALFFLGLDAVFSIISVLLFGTPASPKDLAVMTAILMVVNAIWLGALLMWERIRRKRRRDRLGG
jgi:divalent metal cation (Fe/Co/Zn/Cd) transporter